MMTRYFALPLLLLCAFPARAETVKYYEDPVYEKMNAEDHHPMEDMQMLAEQGDARAQFILGDLYAKGKGGFVKSEKAARQWFENSARNGYAFSFIRLAALEKRAGKPVTAYQWYTLAADHLRGDDRSYASRAREELVKAEKMTPDELKKGRQMARDWRHPKTEKENDSKKAKGE